LAPNYFFELRTKMKLTLTVIAACLATVSLNQRALASSTVTLTQEDPQGYFWDARSSQTGQIALQLYQAYLPSPSFQAFTWTPSLKVANSFTVCSLKICLSDNGSGNVVMSTKADLFTITSKSAVLDVTTGRYIQQPAKPANGTALSMGTTASPWTFALAEAAASTGSATTSTSSEVSIMPLGDSITMGWATTATFAQGGYRCPLYTLLKRAGVSFTYAGNGAALEPGIVTACADVHWEGHGGYDIGAIQGVADGDNSIRTFKPEIVLLLGGTNDVAQGHPGSTAGQLSNLLSNIFSQDPNAWVIVSTIPPMNPKASAAISSVAGWATQVPSANAQIKATVARFPRTTLIDFYAAALPNVGANIGTDGIHPSVTGYGILANLWFNAIKAHLPAK
jgi:GDSL-like Lipase/Acylhydrolase family